jgi:hypothetical protein
MTWIEVADTAIKILGGALVAGGFGYLNARLGYKRDDRAQYAKRRRDHLEKVLEMLVEVEDIYIRQKGAIERFRCYKDNNTPKADKASSDFNELDEKLYAATAKFTQSSSVLLIFGEQLAKAKLERYGDAIGDWYEHSFLELDSFPEERIAELRATIRSAREDAFAALASAYRSA